MKAPAELLNIDVAVKMSAEQMRLRRAFSARRNRV